MKNKYELLSEERKEQQDKGLLPEFFSTGGYQMFKEKYLYDCDNFKEQATRISKIAKHLRDPKLVKEYEEIFFNLIWKGWLSCSTPALANTGTKRGMPVSCSGTYVEDSILGFYDNIAENAVLTQEGFGTSVYLGDIRPRGSSISRGGRSAGIVPVMKALRQMSMDVSQGGVRRGSIAMYIPIDHDDFWEAVKELKDDTDSLNIGWCISDEFIKKADQGDKDSQARFQKVMATKMTTGKGYFHFTDKTNRHRPVMYKDKGLDIKASNLCVAGDTEILTDKGYLEIQGLEGCNVRVWNGEEFSDTVVHKTGVNKELVKVNTNSFNSLECTPFHKFYVKNSYRQPAKRVDAKDLKIGDKLLKSDYPIIQGEKTLKKAYTNGFFTADGCYYGGRSIIYLYQKKMALKGVIEHDGKWNYQNNNSQERLIARNVEGLKHKFFVPDCTYTVESRLNWLAGLFDGDGTVAKNGTNESLQLCSINLEFLKEVRKLLNTLGISAKISSMYEEGTTSLPLNDGTGGYGDFETKESWRILINSNGLFLLSELGLETYRLKFEKRMPQRKAGRLETVEEVLWEGKRGDTYCFTEPKRGMGVFNGILTGNCDEISLFSDKDHSFTCVLSALNLAKYNEWKDTDTIFHATVFLDCLASEFIERAKGVPKLEKAVRFTEKGRALGLGVCGYHTYLMQEGIPFESFPAHSFNNHFFATMKKESLRASEWLAKELGEPEWCQGYGVRNTHRTALMPTKSTALIMGGISEGISPDPAMVFTQASAAGEINRVNPVLLELMKKKGVYTKKSINEIKESKGSVQGVDWLNDEEKLLFKTAYEINQEVILRQASSRGKHLCQWQSLNLFFSAEEEEEYIAKIHEIAFKDEGIRGLYYVYGKTGVSASKDECIACQ